MFCHVVWCICVQVACCRDRGTKKGIKELCTTDNGFGNGSGCGFFASQAVAIQGAHRGYQLKSADLTCSSLSDLSVYNLRRLFANRGFEFMDIGKQNVPGETGKRKIRNALQEEP